jgi:hypothetical protein
VDRASSAAIFHSDATRFHGQPPREAQVAAFKSIYGDDA